jgi:cytochrome c553
MFLKHHSQGWLVFAILAVSEASAETLSTPHASHIQVLASSCAACHGQQGNSAGLTPVIAATVMHHHAKGLNEDEIQQLAQYFSQQARITAKPVKRD